MSQQEDKGINQKTPLKMKKRTQYKICGTRKAIIRGKVIALNRDLSHTHTKTRRWKSSNKQSNFTFKGT